MECARCHWKLGDRNFIADSKFPEVCRLCFTDEEIYDYCVPQISKEMKGIRPRDKQALLREIFTEFKVALKKAEKLKEENEKEKK